MSEAVPGRSEVLLQLDRLFKSREFARVLRGKSMLQYVLERKLAGAKDEELKETIIGVDVFGKSPSYDPHTESDVRVTARRLRNKLRYYYDGAGRRDPVVIEIPLGSYVPSISYNAATGLDDLNDTIAMHVANAKAAFAKRTPVGHDSAFRYLDVALQKYPKNPQILALKAMVHTSRAMYGKYPRTELETAESLIQGLKGERQPWERYLAEGWITASLHFDWKKAEDCFDRAIELSHGEARYAASWYMAFLCCQLRADEAVDMLEQAVTHFGHNVAAIRGDLAISQIMAGRLDDAEETLTTTLELFPKGHYLPYMHLATLNEARGNTAEAVAAIEQVPVTALESTMTIGFRYLLIGVNGDREVAKTGYEELRSLNESGASFIPASQLAAAAYGAGDHDACVALLTESAVVERDPIINWAGILPFYRDLHYHQGFRSLVTDILNLKLSPRFLP